MFLMTKIGFHCLPVPVPKIDFKKSQSGNTFLVPVIELEKEKNLCFFFFQKLKDV